MNFIDKIIKGFIKSQKGKEELLSEQVNVVKEEFDGKNVEEATKKAVEIIKENPNISAVEFLKRLKDESEISDQIVVDATKEISDEATVEVVEKLDFNSEQISEIIQDTDMEFDMAKKVVAQIPDEKMKEERKRELIKNQEDITLKELDKIRNQCLKRGVQEIICMIKNMDMPVKTGKIVNKINEIMARIVAYDYMQLGSSRIESITQVIPLEKMLEIDFPNIVESQYRVLEEECNKERKEYKEYDKNMLKNIIISKSARKVARDFERTGQWDSQRLETIKKLKEDQRKKFMVAIDSDKRIKLSNREKTGLSRKIGIEEGIDKRLDDLFEKIEAMPQEESRRYISSFERQIQKAKEKKISTSKEQIPEKKEESEKYKRLQQEIGKLNVQIGELSVDEAIKVIGIMSTTLEQRKEAKKVMTPKVKEKQATNNQEKPTGMNQENEDQFSL